MIAEESPPQREQDYIGRGSLSSSVPLAGDHLSMRQLAGCLGLLAELRKLRD